MCPRDPQVRREIGSWGFGAQRRAGARGFHKASCKVKEKVRSPTERPRTRKGGGNLGLTPRPVGQMGEEGSGEKAGQEMDRWTHAWTDLHAKSPNQPRKENYFLDTLIILPTGLWFQHPYKTIQPLFPPPPKTATNHNCPLDLDQARAKQGTCHQETLYCSLNA